LPSTTSTDAASVTATSSGMSSRSAACSVSCPSPGQPKMLSTMTVPPISSERFVPISVTNGISALGSAWRSSSATSPMPCARANWT
jgi:hypothetical protein